MAGVRALMMRVFLPVTVIIWLIMCAVITVQAASTENNCRAEKSSFEFPVDKTAVHIQKNFRVCRKKPAFKTQKMSILFLTAHTKLLSVWTVSVH
jgi:hypothetical protein